MNTGHLHICFGMAHCQNIVKIEKYVIMYLNQLLVPSHYSVDTIYYCHTLGVRNEKYLKIDGVVPHPLNKVM